MKKMVLKNKRTMISTMRSKHKSQYSLWILTLLLCQIGKQIGDHLESKEAKDRSVEVRIVLEIVSQLLVLNFKVHH